MASAALYFRPTPEARIPLTWFEGVEALFTSVGREIVAMAVTADRFPSEGPYLLAREREKLIGALKATEVTSLGLYSNRESYDDLIDWAAFAYADIKHEHVYIGMESSILDDAALLLQQAFAISAGLPEVPYGIGFYRNEKLLPQYYVLGYCPSREYEADEMETARITAWMNEMDGQKRYLDGMFRGAYPASLLSKEHADAKLDSGAPLIESGIGTFTALAANVWLWELTDPEIPAAQMALESAGLTIKPAYDSDA